MSALSALRMTMLANMSMPLGGRRIAMRPIAGADFGNGSLTILGDHLCHEDA
jgi:hypothetical protein